MIAEELVAMHLRAMVCQERGKRFEMIESLHPVNQI